MIHICGSRSDIPYDIRIDNEELEGITVEMCKDWTTTANHLQSL